MEVLRKFRHPYQPLCVGESEISNRLDCVFAFSCGSPEECIYAPLRSVLNVRHRRTAPFGGVQRQGLGQSPEVKPLGRSAEGGELLCSGYRGEALCAGQGLLPLPRKSDACVRLYWVIDWRKIAVFQKLVTVFETKLRPVLKILIMVVGLIPKKNKPELFMAAQM